MPRALIALVLATSFGAAAIHSATFGPTVGRTPDAIPCLVENNSPHFATLATTIL